MESSVPESLGTRTKICPLVHPALPVPEKRLARIVKPSPAKVRNDAALGCLFGLSIADALSAPAGYASRSEIEACNGPAGIVDFIAWGGFPAGSFTKCTQLALATVRGCLRANRQRARIPDLEYAAFVHDEYERWACMQGDPHFYRTPGTVCLDALAEGVRGTIAEPVNASQAPGAVMRMAPVGLLFAPGRAFAMGVEFAAITHGHPSGFLPAGYLAELIANLREGRTILKSAALALDTLAMHEDHEDTSAKVQFARELASSHVTPAKALPALGLGWTGAETLAKGLYCALVVAQWGAKNDLQTRFTEGVLAAVNADSRLESPAAITGAILGAAYGISAVPPGWRKRVEGAKRIRRLAGQLAQAL